MDEFLTHEFLTQEFLTYERGDNYDGGRLCPAHTANIIAKWVGKTAKWSEMGGYASEKLRAPLIRNLSSSRSR